MNPEITDEMRDQLRDEILVMLEFEECMFRPKDITLALLKNYNLRPWISAGYVSAQLNRLYRDKKIKRGRIAWGPVTWRQPGGRKCYANGVCYGPKGMPYAKLQWLRGISITLGHAPIPSINHLTYERTNQ